MSELVDKAFYTISGLWLYFWAWVEGYNNPTQILLTGLFATALVFVVFFLPAIVMGISMRRLGVFFLGFFIANIICATANTFLAATINVSIPFTIIGSFVVGFVFAALVED